MGKLSDHKDEIAQAYFIEGRSYQEIADVYGKSREGVRQFLNRYFPDRMEGRAFRSDVRAQAKRKERQDDLEERKKTAPPCVICGDPVTRPTGGRGENRTCCPHHSELWAAARFLLSEELREKQRLSQAQSILRYPELHTPSEVGWANKIVDGLPITPRPYVRKHKSQARLAYEEVMRIRVEKGF